MAAFGRADRAVALLGRPGRVGRADCTAVALAGAEFEQGVRFSGENGVAMIVGVAVIEIHVEDSQSLKAKRGVVRSIAGRLRSRFNVSVGEVGGQGTWQRATIGLSMTGSDETSIRRALQKTIEFVEETHLAQVLASDLEIIRLPLSEVSGFGAGDATPEDGEQWPWQDAGEDEVGLMRRTQKADDPKASED